MSKSQTVRIRPDDEKIDWPPSLAFMIIHLSCLLVFAVGFSWTALAVCVLSYAVRMFGITAGYHRYFSHRSYKTTRFFQFCMAFLGGTAAQKGGLWWAAHHRHHHQHSDTEEDIHSPVTRTFWWSHIAWILCRKYEPTRFERIKDLEKFPELRFLNSNHLIPPICYGAFILALGFALQYWAPALGTTAAQIFVWGFLVSTTFLYHGTFTINSLSHVYGQRRYDTGDHSRNNLWLALITLGEGWHNNHHKFPSAARQGFFWWEIDVAHMTLRGLAALGIVWDLRAPPKKAYDIRETLQFAAAQEAARKQKEEDDATAAAAAALSPPRV